MQIASTLIGHLPEGITSAIPVKEQGGQEKILMRKAGQVFSSCIIALLSHIWGDDINPPNDQVSSDV